MAFDVFGPRDASGRRHHVAVDDDVAQILFQRLPAERAIVAPVCARLWEAFYESPRVDGPELSRWRDELEAIGRAVSARRHTLRQSAPDLEVFLSRSAVLERLGQLQALCDDALARGSGVVCESD